MGVGSKIQVCVCGGVGGIQAMPILALLLHNLSSTISLFKKNLEDQCGYSNLII